MGWPEASRALTYRASTGAVRVMPRSFTLWSAGQRAVTCSTTWSMRKPAVRAGRARLSPRTGSVEVSPACSARMGSSHQVRTFGCLAIVLPDEPSAVDQLRAWPTSSKVAVRVSGRQRSARRARGTRPGPVRLARAVQCSPRSGPGGRGRNCPCPAECRSSLASIRSRTAGQDRCTGGRPDTLIRK
jgi:hypothetical protein